MTRAYAKRKGKQGQSHRRIPVSLLLGILAVSAVATAVGLWNMSRGTGEDLEATKIPVGMPVASFRLPDLVSGSQFDLADYLGKQDIVLVSYMGWFCPGCQQLLVELQGRQTDFTSRGSKLVVPGSKPESESFVKTQIAKYGITYPILYDAGTATTKQAGLWSEMMQMPWMGYLVIDKRGRVAAGNLQLSEVNGAARANVDRLLQDLDAAEPK